MVWMTCVIRVMLAAQLLGCIPTDGSSHGAWTSSSRHARTVAERVGDPRRDCGVGGLGGQMASLVFLGIVVAVAGIGLGAYLKVSFTINREDRSGSITGGAPNCACRNAGR